RAFKPFRHLTVMVNPGHNFAAGTLASTGVLRRFASAAAGAYLGTRAGIDDEEEARRERGERFRPESTSVPDPVEESYRIRVASMRADGAAGARVALDGGAARALPSGRNATGALVSGPGGRSGGRAEDVTVHLEPAPDPVALDSGNGHRRSN